MADPIFQIRVVIVDDSEVARTALKIILEAEHDIVVVGQGCDGFSAASLVEEHKPDVVTLDVHMPGKSGIEAVEQIMARCPVPILVVTGEPIDDTPLALRAIERGAMEIVTKPSLHDEEACASLRAVVRSLSREPVFFVSSDQTHSTKPPRQ